MEVQTLSKIIHIYMYIYVYICYCALYSANIIYNIYINSVLLNASAYLLKPT